MSFEGNTINSFRKVREDIENLQHQILQVREKIEDLDKILLKKEKRVNSVKTKKGSKKK